MISLRVEKLLKDTKYNLDISLVAGEGGLKKKIFIPRIQKPGLALTGEISHIVPGRILIFGNSETKFLRSLALKNQKSIIQKICSVDLACIVITNGQRILPTLKERCQRRGIPLLLTGLNTATFINHITRMLEEKLSASTSLHGVLVDIFGIGLLLIGKSGVGISECALDLVLRGHRLVADDVVDITRRLPSTLYGSSAGILKYHMEIRGLGIINIKDLFGISSIRDRKIIELVIELIEWDSKQEYDRLGIDSKTYNILGVELPYLQLPVRPGRNMASIIEVAARDQLLKLKGIHSAQEFQTQLDTAIARGEVKGRDLIRSRGYRATKASRERAKKQAEKFKIDGTRGVE